MQDTMLLPNKFLNVYGIIYRLKYFHINLHCYGRVALDKCNISRRVKSKTLLPAPTSYVYVYIYKQNGAWAQLAS